MKNPMRRYRWLIFGILAIAYFFVYFHRLSLSVVADDLLTDFQTSAGVIGLLGSMYFYCYAAMQMPAGLLADSIGPRKTVTLFLVIASAGSICFGMAPNIESAFIARVLVGFGVSMVFIPTMKILAQWFKKAEFAQMAGILNAVGGAGVLGATWALALMTSHIGWRASFEIIGLTTLVIAILAWIIVRDRPEDMGWALADGGGPDSANQPPQVPIFQGLKRVLSEKHFWPVALWFFFDCGVFFGFGALWGGPYLMHVYGYTRETAGVILSMIAWGMIIGSPLIGLLSDRILKSRKKPFVLCAAILCGLLLYLFLYPAGQSRLFLFFFFFVFSVCASAIVIIGFTTTKELFPVSMAGTSVGCVNLFPFLGGAVFMPLLGRVLDRFPGAVEGTYAVKGFRVMILVLLISAGAALICSLFMKETYE